MNQHYFDVPFAFGGDVTAIPDPLQTGGTVSFTEGWNYNYQRDLATDPAALPIDRSTMNWLLLQITTALQALQQTGCPEFITSAQNGGTAFSYGKGSRVLWSASGSAPFTKFVNLNANNTNIPSLSDPTGATTGWQIDVDPISTSAQAAAGTDNASIMTPLLVAQQTALRALLAGSATQVFNVATATASSHAVALGQLASGTININNHISYNAHGTYNFTVPANVTTLWLDGSAAGAGAGGSGGVTGVTTNFSATGGGGGGGNGQFVLGQSIAVTPGQVLTVTIGQGGTGGIAGTGTSGSATNGGNGNNGGNTTIVGTGVNITLTGGTGGNGSPLSSGDSVGNVGGAGGSGNASSGSSGMAVASYGYDHGGLGGSGGSTPFGFGGGAVSSQTAGKTGTGNGSGGSGGGGSISNNFNAGYAGGNGTDGFVRFQW